MRNIIEGEALSEEAQQLAVKISNAFTLQARL